MDLELSGKVALVTGGGRNVGRAVCLRLAREGAHVVVNDFYTERADTVAKEITGAGDRAVGIHADITQEDQVRAMVERAAHELGPVDILVNNAGIPASGSGGGEANKPGGGRRAHWVDFHESSPDLWKKTIELNVYGTMFCTHAVLRSMVERRSGKIVSVMSEAGRVGEAKLAAYSGAKASILGFSKAVAREGMGQGLHRLSRPDDVADAVAFLSSDRARYITGQCLGLSGGFAMP